MDIRAQFGQRLRELRARSGMSQDMLADRSGLDRTYISGVERGERNISLVNIEKLAAALQVSMEYLFSGERFSASPAYQPKDFIIPFKDRFHYHLDREKKLLSFQITGLFSGKQDVDYLASVILGVCSEYGKEQLHVLVDHRDMKASDGEPAVYSPEVAERAVGFQQELLAFSKKVVCLCNSDYMVQQLNTVASKSGIISKATHLFHEDAEMVGKAYTLLDINGNELVKARSDSGYIQDNVL